jgi:antitoxin (DNA-binding transcriptional repressor) of toxin-antitoxin stability system
MNLLTVGEFKAKFSDVVKMILAGKQVGVSYGKKKEPIAILVPYKKYKTKKRKLGILEGKASFKFKKGFKMTDEEFLAS